MSNCAHTYRDELIALLQRHGLGEFTAAEFTAATGIDWRRLRMFIDARVIVRTHKWVGSGRGSSPSRYCLSEGAAVKLAGGDAGRMRV